MNTMIHKVWATDYSDYIFVDDEDLSYAKDAGEILVDEHGDYVFKNDGAYITAAHALD